MFQNYLHSLIAMWTLCKSLYLSEPQALHLESLESTAHLLSSCEGWMRNACAGAFHNIWCIRDIETMLVSLSFCHPQSQFTHPFMSTTHCIFIISLYGKQVKVYEPHFVEAGTETQREKVICSKSQSQSKSVAELGCNPDLGTLIQSLSNSINATIP